jgi:3-isopropylmalate/(R)-2-methylmalate dehydratase large subunit
MSGQPSEFSSLPSGAPCTIIDRIWQRHTVRTDDTGRSLLYAARHLLYDASFYALDMLERSGRPVRRPDLTFGTMDHFVATQGADRQAPKDADVAAIGRTLAEGSARYGYQYFGIGDPRQGIVHVIAPELGLTLPGLVIVCNDSHTSTQGALGALAFGIGATDAYHVLASQTLWCRKPAVMRVSIEGRRGFGVTAKDLTLAVIGKLGAGGGVGRVFEFTGPAVGALTAEERMTLCNMAVEAGGWTAIIAPDDTTFAYLKGRPHVPAGAAWDRAVEDWRTLASDRDAPYAAELTFDCSAVEPAVTWGTSPDDVTSVGGRVPDPQVAPDARTRQHMHEALAYMGLVPGQALDGLAVDRVFIGSCTNGRLDDLRAAAEVARHGHTRVPAIVVPGSTSVQRAAEAEGLADIFRAAGFEWREPGCSMCVGQNGDLAIPGERCASTTNRNFVNRQGRGVRTHLMSPAMAAAAALAGCITDVRKLAGARA